MTIGTNPTPPSTTLPLRPLGRTGLMVSPLGLGSLSFGVSGLPSRKQLPAGEVERAFHEHGINTFLVSAAMPQQLEGVRRLLRAGHRDRLVLVSLSGLPFGWALERGLHQLLRQAGTDVIDVYLMGWVRGHWHVTGRSWPTMRKLKEQGKVRALGYSCHDRPLALALCRELAPDVMMLRYNAAHRGVEREVFAHLPPERPGIISYTATRWGQLLLPAEGYPTPMAAPECYRFVLGHPAVDLALCAATTAAQLHEDVEGVLAGPLSEQRISEVRAFGDAVHRTARGGPRFMFRQG